MTSVQEAMAIPAGTTSRAADTSIVRRVRTAFLASGVLMLVILAMGGAWTYVSNRNAAKIATESTARLMAAQVERLLDSVDLALVEMRRYAATADWSRPETPAEARALLHEYQAALPLAFRLFIWSPEGDLLVSSEERMPAGLNARGRSYFENQRGADSLQVGAMTRSRIDNQPVISFSRRVSGPDGGFRGVVSLGMQISDVTAIYQSLQLFPDTLFVWIGPEQGILLRQPAVDLERASGGFDQNPVRDRLRRGEDSGWIDYLSQIDGRSRLAFFQRVHRQELYVLVSVSDASIWRDWLEKSFPYFLIGLLSCAGFIGASIYALRWGQQEDGYRQALAQVNDELERRVAQRTASLSELLAEREGLLEQKDILIQEVNHRVKNSLQQVASLLHLQMRQLPDGLGRAALEDARGRVMSIGRVHEQLYSSDFTGSVALRPYFEVLCEDIRASAAGDCAVETDVADTVLPLARTVPLALIANELLTNAFKHGRRPDGSCRIQLRLRERGDGMLVLAVSDEGPGLVPGKQRRGSLGMRLIRLFVDQLDGKLDIESTDPGTRISVTFPREFV